MENICVYCSMKNFKRLKYSLKDIKGISKADIAKGAELSLRTVDTYFSGSGLKLRLESILSIEQSISTLIKVDEIKSIEAQ